MRKFLITLVFVCFSTITSAQTLIPNMGQVNFLSDGNSINNPNCLTNPLPPPSGSVFVGDAPFPLRNNDFLDTNVRFRYWRVSCPDGQTEILMNFENISGDLDLLPHWTHMAILSQSGRGGIANLYEVPSEFGSIPATDSLLIYWGIGRLAVSPTYILKLDPSFPADLRRSDMEGPLTLGFINIELENDFNPLTAGELTAEGIISFTLPASNQMATSPQFNAPPLTGRHAGSWTVENTADQGFVLSISELPNRQLVASLGWFTYDASNNATWYTGSAFFQMGDNQINFNLTSIQNGQFNSNQAGNRRVIAPASLRVVNCELLVLTYDLTTEGLDAGSVNLRRVFDGEIAGYPCRNLQDRQ